MGPIEFAVTTFHNANTNIRFRPDRTSPEVQYALNLATGLVALTEAIRDISAKLDQIDRKLSHRP